MNRPVFYVDQKELKLTVDLHEHQRGHVVDVEDGALDA